jgi:hypothetical protein
MLLNLVKKIILQTHKQELALSLSSCSARSGVWRCGTLHAVFLAHSPIGPCNRHMGNLIFFLIIRAHRLSAGPAKDNPRDTKSACETPAFDRFFLLRRQTQTAMPSVWLTPCSCFPLTEAASDSATVAASVLVALLQPAPSRPRRHHRDAASSLASSEAHVRLVVSAGAAAKQASDATPLSLAVELA